MLKNYEDGKMVNTKHVIDIFTFYISRNHSNYVSQNTFFKVFQNFLIFFKHSSII